VPEIAQNGSVHSVRPLAADSPGAVEALVGVFDTYRVHYGEAADPERSARWLTQTLAPGGLQAFVAQDGSTVVGFVTVLRIPASLRLGHFWQIRDLFVVPSHRRRGVALTLLEAVRSAAAASGASRLVLQTEEDNDGALALYRRAGFVPVTGYRGLVLPLSLS
jgi:ribosomal protein S18 acetylase RimI-like enzyme